ncbi:MAG: tetratricopeptide repeat protein [Bacteroidetes bacterium]|nr:tetratricopeptide repeat protein [Bacteroidota bacterium]
MRAGCIVASLRSIIPLLLALLIYSIAWPESAAAQARTSEQAYTDSLLEQIPAIACTDTAKALSISRSILQKAVEEGNVFHESYACLAIGTVYLDAKKQSVFALPWLRRALNGLESLGKIASTAAVHFAIGRAIHGMPVPKREKDFSAVERHHRKAVALSEQYQPGALPAYLWHLAASVQLQGRHDEAMNLYRRSAELADSLHDLRWLINATNNIGFLYSEHDQLDSALVYLQKTIPIAESFGDDGLISRAYINVANILMNLGRIRDAGELLEKAHDRAEQADCPGWVAAALMTMGSNLRSRGKYDESSTLLRKSLLLFEENLGKNAFARAAERAILHRLLGQNSIDLKQHAEAITHYRKAAALYQTTGSRDDEATVLTHLSWAYFGLARLKEARLWQLRALGIMREADNLSGTAGCLHDLARILTQQDSTAAAREALEEALAIYTRVKIPSQINAVRRDLGRLHLNAGRLTEAADLLTVAVDGHRTLEEYPMLSTALVWLAECRQRQGRHAEVGGLLSEAENLAISVDIPENRLRIAELRARHAAAEGRYMDAHEHWEKFAVLKDSIVQSRHDTRFESLLVEFDAERKDHEIARLTSDRELQRLEMERQRETLRREQLEALRRRQELELLSQDHEIQNLELHITNAELRQQKAASNEQQQRLALARKDRALQAEILQRETLRRNAAIAGFLVLALLSILVVRSLRLRRRESEARATAAQLQAQAARSESLRVRAESAEREEEVQRRFARQLIHAQEQERQRIASDLHDSLAQKLVVIQNRATLALQRPIQDEYLARQFEQISGTAIDTVSEVRAISHALRPQLLNRFGLSSALRNLVEEINNVTHISWEGHVDDLTGLLSPDDEINLYRIVQEGMNNTIKHAGATSGQLDVHRADAIIHITLSDNGKGFQPDVKRSNGDGGLGLQSMQQRADLLSAELRIESAPGNGTRITIDIPIPPADSSPDGPEDGIALESPVSSVTYAEEG